MSTCSICCDDFTKQPHKKPAKCPYCPLEACVKCTQTYLLGTLEDPHCMGCRKAWTREVMDSILLTTWINGDYKKHREDVLIDRERSRLPAAQIIIERQKEAEARAPNRVKLARRIQELECELAKARADYYHEERVYQQLMAGVDPFAERTATGKVKDEEKRVFVMPCPANGCRGFLSTAYKCGICDMYTCPDCREIKGPERDGPHTCDKDAVATVQRLKKECRGCPECGANIFKIEGCDQMYCTACNTPFSWTTGKKIVNGAIHNPHYFEYLRKTNGGAMPRNPGDIPCIANLPNAWQWEREVTRKFNITGHKQCMDLYQALNVITHIQHVEIPHATNRAQDTDHTDVNVKYLKKEIDQTRWKQTLQQREKRRIKRDELRMRLEAFVGACVDIFGRVMTLARELAVKTGTTPVYPTGATTDEALAKAYRQKVKDHQETIRIAPDLLKAACNEAFDQLQSLRGIFNESMMDISKRYKCQVLQLTDAMRRETKKYESGRARRVKKSDNDTVGSSDVEDEGPVNAPVPKNTVVRTA